MKSNLVVFIGFIFVGVVIYMDYVKQVWGEVSEDPKRLIWYGVGCAILIIGIVYKRLKSARI